MRGRNFHPPPQKDSWNKHCSPVQFVCTTVNKRLQLRLSLVLKLSPWMGGRNVRRILVRGSMPPCRLRRRKFRKFDFEIVHSEVYLNKYVVCIAPFSTPACHDCSQKYNINIENCPVCMFPLFNFSSIFPGGQLTPFAPMCGRPWQVSGGGGGSSYSQSGAAAVRLTYRRPTDVFAYS